MHFFLIVTYCFLLILAIEYSDEQLMKYFSFDAGHEHSDIHAVCNDGTRGGNSTMRILMINILMISNTAGYYFSPASSAELETIYVIHLAGESSCWDEQSCANRLKDPSLFSSSQAPQRMRLSLGGSLVADMENSLQRAHSASLLYCSSDAFMGNVGASAVRHVI